jgi:ATP-binding protein involved in chromosome partitioning
MTDDLAAAVTKALAAVKDPASGRDVVAAGMVQGLVVRDGMVHFALGVAREAAASMDPVCFPQPWC